MDYQLKIIPSFLLSEFCLSWKAQTKSAFIDLYDAELSTDNFCFYTAVASVYSSKIEGEEIELDSYIKYKRFGIEFLPKYTQKIDDLYDAYSFAKKNTLNRQNIVKAHKLLSKHIISKQYQGKLRTQYMYVTTPDSKIEYVAASPFMLEVEMDKFYQDLQTLLAKPLSIEEAFYFASMIHLVFVKIHPWNDGNGRTARLLEKWFLAHFLGEKTWYIQSEKNYYLQLASYYQNIRTLGLEYLELDYKNAMPYLLMLPKSLL